MTKPVEDDPSFLVRAAGPNSEIEHRLPFVAQYAIAFLLVAVAALLAFAASSVVPGPGLTLIFVLPVVIAGTAFGLGPSVAATVASVLAFDFFFTQPYMSLRIADPSDIWAAGLLLVTAAIVSTVAWQSRQHALESRKAAAQADELRLLAHAVIQGASQAQIVQAATTAIGRIFGGPAAIFSETDGRMRVEATTGNADLSEAETEAAKGALTHVIHIRAETYPHERSRFDMWPVATSTQCRYVISVDFGRAAYERPADADRLVEIVAGYIVANLART